MDMRTILTLRAASQHTMYAVAAMLRLTLERLCDIYLPRARTFLNALDNLGGFIGGVVAASFLIRQLPARSAPLEVFVSWENWAAMVDELNGNQGCGMGHITQAEDDYVENWLERHAVESSTPFFTLTGREVILYESTTSDALAPIACRSSTVEVAYVNPIYFGTGYAHLTLSRRGLVADTRAESDSVDVGVDVRFSPKEWKEYQGMTCAASVGLCPFQLRTFTDGTSMRCRMIPPAADPLTSRVGWRLAARRCGVECRGVDGMGSAVYFREKFVNME
ncbi:hypothetical protein OH76DRAFT_1366900 [Lentinus brumalis]|uniref:Uncharacterized protein n=1 Tax=Lentinus brumalis TaxID=2498619 RepID=A0A371CI93_9APHY|nr:hypothetical protein OH76DRAFT_1366900 [Polyporus brumalis]